MHQTKESNKRAPGRVVIYMYISVHIVLIYTTLAFSNACAKIKLLFMQFSQVRTFLLFTI